MQIRSASKAAVAVAAALAYVASMASMVSAGGITAGQITISGSSGVVVDFPAPTSPCTTPVAPTLSALVTATSATVTAVDTWWVNEIAGVPYLIKLTRTASTSGAVTGSGGSYTIGDFTLTLRAQVYETTLPGCVPGTLKCTGNLRLGLHGSYAGVVPSSTAPGGSATLVGGTTSPGGIAITAPGCPAPFNAYHGQAVTITSPLVATLP